MKMIDEVGLDYGKFGYTQKDLGDGIIFSKLNIAKGENKLGFNAGSYRIISVHNLFIMPSEQKDKVVETFVKVLKELLLKLNIKKTDKVIVCGLGNDDILADSFGCKVCDKVLATNGILTKLSKSKVCTISPNVKAVTGLDTLDIVSGIASKICAKLIILVDSLMTKNIERIGHSFQLSTCGIVPGGAIKKGKEISEKTTGVKCLTVGVPFMIDLKSISKKIQKQIIVSPKDCGEMIKVCSQIVADAINQYFNPTLNKNDICELKRGF